MNLKNLILEFLNESHDFALGFECGKVYQEMRAELPEISGYYRERNLEQLKLMAIKFSYSIQEINSCKLEEEQDNDYLFIKFVCMT